MKFRVLYIRLIVVIMSIQSGFKHHYILPGLLLIRIMLGWIVNKIFCIRQSTEIRNSICSYRFSYVRGPKEHIMLCNVSCFFLSSWSFFHIYFRLLGVTTCNNKKFGVILLHCNSLMVRALVHFVWNLYKYLLFGWTETFDRFFLQPSDCCFCPIFMKLGILMGLWDDWRYVKAHLKLSR